MHDTLGNRIKDQYESRTRFMLPRRTYTVIRVDGKAFHTLTRGFDRPFDDDLTLIMNNVAIELCKGIQGAKLAYVQSDEISIVLTDFDDVTTQAWFDGNVQKMVSISAAIATAAFNREFEKASEVACNSGVSGAITKFLTGDYGQLKTAHFDSRVFTIPDYIEVENYLIWRQQDASRNSVQMATRSVYSHKECENKNINEMQDMLHLKGINWNNYPAGHKRGRCIVKEEYTMTVTQYQNAPVTRSRWVVVEPPIFTQDRDFIRKVIPRMNDVGSSREQI